MTPYRNRLIIGIIRRFINVVFTVVYKILSLFNLQFTLLVLLIGLVLFLTGSFHKNPTVLLVFEVILICSIVYAIITTLKRMLGINKKPKKSKGAQILDTDSITSSQEKSGEQQVVFQTVQAVETPTYYRVKQNSEYVMAEYKDRYELYRIIDGQMKKIRTDYK